MGLPRCSSGREAGTSTQSALDLSVKVKGESTLPLAQFLRVGKSHFGGLGLPLHPQELSSVVSQGQLPLQRASGCLLLTLLLRCFQFLWCTSGLGPRQWA